MRYYTEHFTLESYFLYFTDKKSDSQCFIHLAWSSDWVYLSVKIQKLLTVSTVKILKIGTPKKLP